MWLGCERMKFRRVEFVDVWIEVTTHNNLLTVFLVCERSNCELMMQKASCIVVRTNQTMNERLLTVNNFKYCFD